MDNSDFQMKPFKKCRSNKCDYVFAISIRLFLFGAFFTCNQNPLLSQNDRISKKITVASPALTPLSQTEVINRVSTAQPRIEFRNSQLIGKIQKSNVMPWSLPNDSETCRRMPRSSQFPQKTVVKTNPTGQFGNADQNVTTPELADAGEFSPPTQLPRQSSNFQAKNLPAKQEEPIESNNDSAAPAKTAKSIFEQLGLPSIDKIDSSNEPFQTQQAKTSTEETPVDSAAPFFAQLEIIRYGATCGPDCRWHQTGSTAADFSYQPLFWEEINLERHGESGGRLQPLISGTRFFAKFPRLPYKMTQMPPRQHFNKASIYPAGLPAPWVNESYEFSKKAGLVEGLSIGAVFLIFP